MPTLQLIHISEINGKHQIRLVLKVEGQTELTSSTELESLLTGEDQEEIRWYFEDYFDHPYDPSPSIASRVEERMTTIGIKLFNSLFNSSKEAIYLWTELSKNIKNTRIEVISALNQLEKIPWELIRQSELEDPIVLKCRSFVHTYTESRSTSIISQANTLIKSFKTAVLPSKTVEQSLKPLIESSVIRILLVISRPNRGNDVPFRSVANRLVKSLSGRRNFELDVLRPPTFAQLVEQLQIAKAEGCPYHVVHFDGHGTYALDQNGKHMRGYILFESSESPYMSESQDNFELVHGKLIGQKLIQAGVPILVLNACRSAYSEPAAEPAKGNTNDQSEAFGSFAQEVIATGVSGVVAMRYNVYVTTAAEFIENLYNAIIQGYTLSESVTKARNVLYAHSGRDIGFTIRKLQDWFVPTVFEREDIRLFQKLTKDEKTPDTPSSLSAANQPFDFELPASPKAGFFGRDQILLALDHALLYHNLVLLHAPIGTGKTTISAEFARWCVLTKGIKGQVLFTSLIHHSSLASVLEEFGKVFNKELSKRGIYWKTLSQIDKQTTVLQIMRQTPMLWIWDQLEQVTGIFSETSHSWSNTEREQLFSFLQSALKTRTKFILTSRRDEKAWLDDSVQRINIFPMSMAESAQLARSLLSEHGLLPDISVWWDLIRYVDGNPLVLEIVANQVLKERPKSPFELENLVFRLRSNNFQLDESDNRLSILFNSLDYYFKHSFTEEERKQLSLLHFFQRIVYVELFTKINLPEIEGLTKESAITLFNRLTESGLITCIGENYFFYPILQWYLKTLFNTSYYDEKREKLNKNTVEDRAQIIGSSQQEAIKAFVTAIGDYAVYLSNLITTSDSSLIGWIGYQIDNFLFTLYIARNNQWYQSMNDILLATQEFFYSTGQWVQLENLLNDITPEFMDPTTGEPLPGREEWWKFIIHYRIRLSFHTNSIEEAEFLQKKRLEWARKKAACALTIPSSNLNDENRADIHYLGITLLEEGNVLYKKGISECVIPYEEAYNFFLLIGDRSYGAKAAYNLGNAYLNFDDLYVNGEPHLWYERSEELRDEDDNLGRSRCWHGYAEVFKKRLELSQAANLPYDELLQLFKLAINFYHYALEILPTHDLKNGSELSGAEMDRPRIYGGIAKCYMIMYDFDRAFSYYKESIRFYDEMNNLYYAASIRREVSLCLAMAGRYQDAKLYAQSSYQFFLRLGDRAESEAQSVHRWMQAIEDNYLKG